MRIVLGYHHALLLAVLAAHSLTAAEAHAAQQFLLDEVAQVSGRLAFGQKDLAFNWSDSGVQHVLKGSSSPRGQLTTVAVASPVAVLLLGVAAVLYQQRHKKQLQAFAKANSAGAGGHDEAEITAGQSISDCKTVDAVPEAAPGLPEKTCQEGVGRRKLLSTLLPAVASAAASAHQSVVACVVHIWGNNRSGLGGSELSTSGKATGSIESISSASAAGSDMNHLQVEVPTSSTIIVNVRDTCVTGCSCTTSAPSTKASGSSRHWNSSDQLHKLSAALCAAPSIASSRQSEDYPLVHSHDTIIASSSDSGYNLEQAIRRGHFVSAEGHPHMACITKALVDTAAGLSHLHSMGVVHGDLKPANVLLKSTLRGFRCKITEFGLGQVLGEDATNVNARIHGLLDYTAPEVLQEGCLTAAADIYSFGLIMWELYTGTRVFGEGLSLGQIYCMVALHGWRPGVLENMPADYAALMQACWHADHHQRPTICQVLMALQEPCFSRELTGYWEPRGSSAFVSGQPRASGTATYCGNRQDYISP